MSLTPEEKRLADWRAEVDTFPGVSGVVVHRVRQVMRVWMEAGLHCETCEFEFWVQWLAEHAGEEGPPWVSDILAAKAFVHGTCCRAALTPEIRPAVSSE